VEIRHSYNQKIIEGYSVQLQAYKKSEEILNGFYVIIDVEGGWEKGRKNL
jgi:hypothetical protein